MVDRGRSRQAAGGRRGLGFRRALALLFVLALVAMPFALINSGFAQLTHGPAAVLQTLLLLSALLGVSLLFVGMATNIFRAELHRFLALSGLQKVHDALGWAGTGFVVLHLVFGLPIIGTEWAGNSHAFFVLGPAMLLVLALTFVGAHWAKRLLRGRWWSRLHVVNYLVFTGAVLHGGAIGTDAATVPGRLVLGACAVIVLAGVAYRARSPAWRKTFLPVGRRVKAK